MKARVNWKSRYVEVLDQKEKQQQIFRKRISLLSTAMVNAGALARGMDQAADEKLLAIQALLRRDKLKNVDLEPAVTALDKQIKQSLEIRRKYLEQITSDLRKISKQARSGSSDVTTVNALKQLEKSFKGKSKQFKEIPDLLGQLVLLHKDAIRHNPHVAGKSLMNRWFGGGGDVEGTATEEDFPPGADETVDCQEEAVLTGVEDSATHSDQHSETVIEDQGTEIQEALSASLSSLLQHICPVEELRDLHKSTLNLLSSDFRLDQIPEIISSVCELMSSTMSADRSEFETFLSQLNERLSEANDCLLSSQQINSEGIEADRQLNDSIRERMVQIKSSVSDATDIEQLKVEVSANVEQMVSVLDVHQQKSQERQHSLSSELNSLVDRVRHMEDVSVVTERRLEEQRLIATTDALTQLPNREAYNQRAEQELKRWQRYEHPLCLAVCDIDFFKKVNDTWGHACGDEVLKSVASILKGRVRESDFISRYGGEEFVVLLPETEKDQAFKVMETLRQAVEENEFKWEAEKLAISISIGLADFKGKDNIESAFTRADRALYDAKESGRNRTVKTAEY